MTDINWNLIRALNGSQWEGFEELCCQLADAECSSREAFWRKAPPDAGVECYVVFADGTEWAWQAKYVHSFEETQLREIDESVKRALATHPRMTKYFVCAPLNLQDPRIPSQQWAQDRWDRHIAKWRMWAQQNGMSVEFVFWGQYQLNQRLMLPEHAGRLWYWFHERLFDQAWFEARWDEARASAGPRYTPEINVDLPIAAHFEALGRTELFFNRLKIHAKPIRRALESINHEFLRPGPAEPRGQEPEITPELKSRLESVLLKVTGVIERLRTLVPSPTDALELDRLAAFLAEILEETESVIDAGRSESDQDGAVKSTGGYSTTERLWESLAALGRDLRSLHSDLSRLGPSADGDLLLLLGEAGTGKTHLLCDVAHRRLKNNTCRPTILAMGQRFTSLEDPWSQLLKQLDLYGRTVQEFIGALEAAAQAARCKALVLIDALNEGAGRQIWPAHLPAFLQSLQRSPWISVAISVRSTYQEMIPADIQRGAVTVVHRGFFDQEYDAVRTFFEYYHLELPSTPLLIPEFNRPLFLKLLCRGLAASGQRRLPRGLQGITAIFGLFVDAVNSRLAIELDFDPRTPIVSQALALLIDKFVESRRNWLPYEEAKALVDGLLTPSGHSRSLFNRLFDEGLLIEERIYDPESQHTYGVQIAYERLADHLMVKRLLDLHLDGSDSEKAFAENGPLAFLRSTRLLTGPGLLEALCVQVPERTGRELEDLSPSFGSSPYYRSAFLQSLIWRVPSAFSESTEEIFYSALDYSVEEAIDVLLITATIPGHPFNAGFLHELLSADEMPIRDSWWSTALHWKSDDGDAPMRLIQWAWSISQEDSPDEEGVDLAAIALAWMFSTPNRYVRDRATKAAVALLTGRIALVLRLVERFAAVDDPYVVERVYAVAYGCAMRSSDRDAVGALAQVVYNQVFLGGTPPPQILLRDYARGVVERALHLGSALIGDVGRIRPPYHSTWPHIPSQEEIAQYKVDSERGTWLSMEPEWGARAIWGSIFGGDFGLYVIGTNSGHTNWLSRRLSEPPWLSRDEQLEALIAEFSPESVAAWHSYQLADTALHEAMWPSALISIFGTDDEEDGEEQSAADAVDEETNMPPPPELGPEEKARLTMLETAREEAMASVYSSLQADQAEKLQALLSPEGGSFRAHAEPRFDLRLIQRYVLWRVFDLGWTIDLFGNFERFGPGLANHGRGARKPERMGKKYQWIAYHEIMALISDHYQYREEFSDDGTQHRYLGPWQESFRDIDPSCILRQIPVPVNGVLQPERLPWWCPVHINNWRDPEDEGEWVVQTGDLPAMEPLLAPVDQPSGDQWLSLHGSLYLTEPVPVDQDRWDSATREIRYAWDAYLVSQDEVQAFMEWARTLKSWGHSMPDPPRASSMYLGEHVWSPAAKYYQREFFGDDGWTHPNGGCPALIRITSVDYLQEYSGFDCSVDTGFHLSLPIDDLVKGMDLHWTQDGAGFADHRGRILTFDPAELEQGPNALLARLDSLREFLDRQGLTVCWTIWGMKLINGGGRLDRFGQRLELHGAYFLEAGRPVGFLKYVLEDYRQKGDLRSTLILEQDTAKVSTPTEEPSA